MTEDFAVLDFALVPAGPATVARALAEAWPQVTAPQAATDRPRPGLLGRLMGRGARGGAAGPVPGLTLHTAGLMPDPPFARVDPTAPPLRDSAVRLSRVPGAQDTITLIELMEDLDTEAHLCRALSGALPGVELFYFRYSGMLHPGAHFAMHVYRDGRALRRAASLSLAGQHAEAGWSATDAGMPHPAEADCLPPPEAPAAEIMTPERQGAILAALGIDADRLFTGMEGRTDVLVLSPLPGGAPISELDEAARGAGLVVPPAFSFDARPDSAAPPSTAPGPMVPPEAPPLTQARADTPLPTSAEAWEQEVTQLLLACVEAALPEEDRVAWFEGFTAALEAGDTGRALDSAEELIAATGRPRAQRAAAMARLRLLYAHLAP